MLSSFVSRNIFRPVKETARKSSDPRGTTNVVSSKISWWTTKTREQGKQKGSEFFLQLGTILKDK